MRAHRITPPKRLPRYMIASNANGEHWWWCARCRTYGPIDKTEQRAIQGFNYHAINNCVYDYGAQP